MMGDVLADAPVAAQPDRPGANAAGTAVLPALGAQGPHGGLLALQREAGNRAATSVARLLARQAQLKRSKPLPLAIGLDPSKGTIAFETRKATVGNFDVHFTGRLAVSGRGSIEDEEIPKPLPKKTTAGGWLHGRARELATQHMNGQSPSGDALRVELDVGGLKLALDLAQEVAGIPPFAISGHFSLSAKQLAKQPLKFGTVEIGAGAAVTLDATAWITPKAASGAAPPAPKISDALVKKFALGESAASFEDTHKEKGVELPRTGALNSLAILKRFEELPDVVKQHKFLRLPEQRIAFFQEMRFFFDSDERTIEHFKKIRQVRTKKNVDRKPEHSLLLHDEAASRLEAVEAELGADLMPHSTVGWPRRECSLGGEASLANLHNLGFAVDYNAYEMPHLAKGSARQRLLIKRITGEDPEMKTGSGWHTTGDYDEMIKRTGEKAVMAEPDPGSKLGELMTKIEDEATKTQARSDKFRRSLDYTNDKGEIVDGAAELARLRELWFTSVKPADKGGDPSKWGPEEEKAFARTLTPWTKLIEPERKEAADKVTAAGFDLSNLKEGKALAKEEKALKDAARSARAVLGKPGTSGPIKQRKTANAVVKSLRSLLGSTSEADPAAMSEADLRAELETLSATAATRLGGYDDVRTYQHWDAFHRPDWIFGNWKEPTVAGDPSLAQLVTKGFFSLYDAPTDTAPGGFGIKFMKLMVKHGFNHGATWGTPDFMHFELRWTGPAAVKARQAKAAARAAEKAARDAAKAAKAKARAPAVKK